MDERTKTVEAVVQTKLINALPHVVHLGDIFLLLERFRAFAIMTQESLNIESAISQLSSRSSIVSNKNPNSVAVVSDCRIT